MQGPKIGCICGWFPQLWFGYMWTYIYIYIYIDYDDDNRPILEIGWNFIFCENAYVFPWDMTTMVWNWLVNLYICVCVCVCVCYKFIRSKIYKVHKLDDFLISIFIYVMATRALILLFFIFTMLKIIGFDWNYIEFLFFATMTMFFLGIWWKC